MEGSEDKNKHNYYFQNLREFNPLFSLPLLFLLST